MKRAIVTPDKHFPYEDKPAIKVLCKAIELVKPDIYIDLGDTGEWESVSHWQWKKKKRPPLEYQLPFVHKEIKAVNKGLDGEAFSATARVALAADEVVDWAEEDDDE